VISSNDEGVDGVWEIEAGLMERLERPGPFIERARHDWRLPGCRALWVASALPFCSKFRQDEEVRRCARGRGRG
jgi:hypothetical protein